MRLDKKHEPFWNYQMGYWVCSPHQLVYYGPDHLGNPTDRNTPPICQPLSSDRRGRGYLLNRSHFRSRSVKVRGATSAGKVVS